MKKNFLYLILLFYNVKSMRDDYYVNLFDEVANSSKTASHKDFLTFYKKKFFNTSGNISIELSWFYSDIQLNNDIPSSIIKKYKFSEEMYRSCDHHLRKILSKYNKKIVSLNEQLAKCALKYSTMFSVEMQLNMEVFDEYKERIILMELFDEYKERIILLSALLKEIVHIPVESTKQMIKSIIKDKTYSSIDAIICKVLINKLNKYFFLIENLIKIIKNPCSEKLISTINSRTDYKEEYFFLLKEEIRCWMISTIYERTGQDYSEKFILFNSLIKEKFDPIKHEIQAYRNVLEKYEEMISNVSCHLVSQEKYETTIRSMLYDLASKYAETPYMKKYNIYE